MARIWCRMRLRVIGSEVYVAEGKAMRLCPILFSAGAVFCLIGTAWCQEITLPPSMDAAEDALKNSPRHGEFVNIEFPGETPIKTWVVYPERADRAPVILVIHEIFGMTDWVNAVADNLAEQGFIALAPDMISGMEGNPLSVVRALTREQIVERLNVVRDYALALPAANGKCGSIGFCWGGSASFIYATAQPKLDAAVVCYGTAPPNEELSKIEAPLLGLFGEMDARVNTTIGPAKELLDSLGKTFDYKFYDNAGHGFLRAQSGRGGDNGKATAEAWPTAITFFRKHLETSSD